MPVMPVMPATDMAGTLTWARDRTGTAGTVTPDTVTPPTPGPAELED
jgi:hypothetical protein